MRWRTIRIQLEVEFRTVKSKILPEISEDKRRTDIVNVSTTEQFQPAHSGFQSLAVACKAFRGQKSAEETATSSTPALHGHGISAKVGSAPGRFAGGDTKGVLQL